MIDSKTAKQQMEFYITKVKVTKIVTLSEIINASSKLGYESVSCWLCKKKLDKFLTLLKKKGYHINRYNSDLVKDMILVDISWTKAKFIPNNHYDL